MEITNNAINEYGKNISKRNDFSRLDTIPIIQGKQCLYVMDWTNFKITYSRGVQEMLGYSKNEFSMELALNYIHPDDFKIVFRIMKGTLENALKIGFKGNNNYALLTYRVQKKNGFYINLLRQSSPWETDSNKTLVSNLSLLTDISFVNNKNNVEWDIYSNGMDNESFKKGIYREFQDFFTKRELEIIQCIANKCGNKKISKHRYISLNTVKSHRKNIFKKCNCHNTGDLLDFCEKNGHYPVKCVNLKS